MSPRLGCSEMVLAPSYTDLLLRLGLSLATSTRPPKDVLRALIKYRIVVYMILDILCVFLRTYPVSLLTTLCLYLLSRSRENKMFVRRVAFHLFKCKERVAVNKHTMLVYINMLWCIDYINRGDVRLHTSRQPPISRRNPSVKIFVYNLIGEPPGIRGRHYSRSAVLEEVQVTECVEYSATYRRNNIAMPFVTSTSEHEAVTSKVTFGYN